MAHARTEIRAALVAALQGLSVDERVYPSRIYTVPDDKLPCLLVNTDDEQILGGDIGTLQERRLTVTIRALAKTVTSVDDDIDALMAEVETRLSGNMLDGLIAGNYLDSIKVDFDESDRPVAIGDMRWSMTYFTHAGAPGITL